ncbi:hypothetical protein ACOSQ3_012732 [Xanthoceras sorbifolium]
MIMILRYERLPEFCSHCRVLGHVTCQCIEVDHVKMIDPQLVEYWGWLRASSPARIRRLNPSHAVQTKKGGMPRDTSSIPQVNRSTRTADVDHKRGDSGVLPPVNSLVVMQK